jgi:hypothetical protein
MNKKFIAFLLMLFISLSQSLFPANAIENGESALNHPRVVSMYFANPYNANDLFPNCSGWLYSPRIVFTAGHCVYDGSEKPKKILRSASNTFVGKPGAVTTYGLPVSQVRASKIYVYESFEWYSVTPGGSLSYKDDFAVVVLEKPLANVEAAAIGTKEFLDNMISKSDFIETSGYGYQDNSRQNKPGTEPKKARFQLVSFETGMKTVAEFKQKWNRTYFQEDAAFVKLPKNGAAPCDGDSGSGYFYNVNGKFTYLGVMMGVLGSPNCGLETWTDTAVGPFRPIYLDVDMVKLAEKYVADNPYVDPKLVNNSSTKKVTITCIKGKAAKKISGVSPKCPVGFLQKNK